MRHPVTFRIRHTHEQDATVAIDVDRIESIFGLDVPRVLAHARSHESRAVGKCRLRAVGVYPGTHIKRARLEQMRNVRVIAEFPDERLDLIQAHSR